jgi:hypothetical protein
VSAVRFTEISGTLTPGWWGHCSIVNRTVGIFAATEVSSTGRAETEVSMKLWDDQLNLKRWHEEVGSRPSAKA